MLSSFPMLVVVVELVVAYIVVTRANPALGLRLWLVLTLAIPCWLGFRTQLTGYVQPTTAIAFAALVGLLLHRQGYLSRKVIGAIDFAVVAIVALAFVAVKYGTPITYGKQALLIWFVPYVLGRFTQDHSQRIGLTFARCGMTMGALSVVEFVTNYHPFANLDTSSSIGFWAAIQYRGNLPRSELSMGHSIALGAVLVATIPFVLTYVQRRGLGVLVVLAGVSCTLSRAAVVGSVLVILLAILPGRGLVLSSGRRIAIATVLGLAALAAVPFLLGVANSSQAELTRSAGHRASILNLVGSARPLGLARNTVFDTATASLNFSGLGSLDNAYLDVALTTGYVISLALLAATVMLVFRYLVVRDIGPAQMALLGLIPFFATVAFITQYGPIAWFLIGWAATEIMTSPQRRRLSQEPSRVTVPSPRTRRAPARRALLTTAGSDERQDA